MCTTVVGKIFARGKKECEERIFEPDKLEDGGSQNGDENTDSTIPREDVDCFSKSTELASLASLAYYVTGFFIAVSVISTVVETLPTDERNDSEM